MTKMAIVNDLHFGVRGDSHVFLDLQEKFFSETFFPKLDKDNIKIILDLGDTFDRRKHVNFVTLNRAKKFFFDEIQKRGIEYHAVVGNHSVYFNNTNEINSLELLLPEYENFHFYIHDPKELVYDGVKILLVPWINRTNDEICLETLRTTDADFVMGHFEIKGFEMMKGYPCEHGMSKDIFSRFEGVYSGHFHHPSEYDNIKYLGAQYEMTWTDYDGKRGFHIFDTQTRDLEFVRNPSRVFYKLIYDDTDMTIEDIANLETKSLKNTFIKVVVKTRSNPYIFDLFINRLVDSGATDVKTVEDSLNLESAGISDILDETKDTRDIIHEYIDSLETNLEKKKIKKFVDILYNEALSVA